MTHSTISVILQRYVMNVDISENTCTMYNSTIYLIPSLTAEEKKMIEWGYYRKGPPQIINKLVIVQFILSTGKGTCMWKDNWGKYVYLHMYTYIVKCISYRYLTFQIDIFLSLLSRRWKHNVFDSMI